MAAKKTPTKKSLTKAELKQKHAAFIERIRTAQANEHQETIFAAAESGAGRYVVLAGPGSGKTFTSIRASVVFPGKSIYFSFNKKIAEDTTEKLKAIDSKMIATTVHAFGLSCLIAFLNGKYKVEEEKYGELVKLYVQNHWSAYLLSIQDALADEDADEDTDPAVLRLDALTWIRTLVHYAQVSLSSLSPQGLVDLIEEFDLEISRFSLAWPFVEMAVPNIIKQGKEQFLDAPHLISYDDMIYLPNCIEGVPVRQYDHILVDEAQDTSRAGLELILQACRSNTQVFFIGDPHQCQPPGTKVRLQSGQECSIECLKVGDQVVTFDRRSAAFVKSGVVSDIATRQYNGSLYNVAAGGKQSKCTDSHKWLVRWVDGEDAWITYLMRQGTRYRVGQTKMFVNVRSKGQNFGFGLGVRARVERADDAWVLKVHSSFREALAYEQVLSATYGLPEVCFNEVSNIRYFKQDMIDYIYDSLPPLEERAKKCLEDHGRRIEYPLYTRRGMNGYNDNRKVNSAGDQQRQGRTTLFETQACNLISGYMAVPVVSGNVLAVHSKLDWQVVGVTIEGYSGVVYSLNIEKHHKYIADGLITCNSIYAFAGAAFDSIDQIIAKLKAETLPLKICYRCGSAIIDIANQIRPGLVSAGLHTGHVEVLPELDYLDRMQPGDAGIARTTHKLVEACLRVLQKGKRAKVLGRNLGDNIAAVVTELEAMRVRRGVPALKANLSNFLSLLKEHHERRAQTLQESRKNPDMALAELEDKIETVRVFFEAYMGKCNDESLRLATDPTCKFERSAKDFKLYITGLFSEDDGTHNLILFMTAHRSKGGEWDNVYIIHPEEFPHPKAKSERQREQERNLGYVAATRAIENLFFVGQPFAWVEVPGWVPPEQRGLTIISYPEADYLEIREEDRHTVLHGANVSDFEVTAIPLRHDEIEDVVVIEAEKLEIVPPVEGRVSRAVTIEVLCPACNNVCCDPATGALEIGHDLVGHTVVCVRCRQACIVPLNAFSLSGNVIAREKPAQAVPNSKIEKKGRTQKERKSNAGRKTKGNKPRQPLQLSLDMRVIRAVKAMGVNASALFEDLLNQYEPFLEAYAAVNDDADIEGEDE